MNEKQATQTDEGKVLSMSLRIASGFCILLGIVSILAPLVAAMAIELFLGVILLLTGSGELVFAWELRSAHGAAWRFLRAACFLLAGIVLLAFPLSGIITLALVLGVMFIMDGVLRIVSFR
jgi:uncharacterized membrane protein HdeD (DUF308 family)